MNEDRFCRHVVLRRRAKPSRRQSRQGRSHRAGFQARVVTTEYVLLEVATFFCQTAHRSVFLGLLQTLQNDPATTIVPSSSDLWQRGVDLFAARLDKDWSLTDCISFVVMQEHGITDALTADHHFEQAGFVALLK
jgi:predicted nucleic acid-binding protein